MAYATVQELTDFLTAAGLAVPDGASVLLDRASRNVDRALLCAVYNVDQDGNPTDAKVLQAVKDATLEQVGAWADTGTAGVPTGYQTVTAGRISLGRDNASGAARIGEGEALAPQARIVLQTADLLAQEPWIG